MDGLVERDQNGKEVRQPVVLRPEEKLIAKKIVLAFKQSVCGFDLLRANGKSYVCDVNGFSFVKNSVKYYDDCSSILANMILKDTALKRQIPYSPMSFMELYCVIALMKQGDRQANKQKRQGIKYLNNSLTNMIN